MKDNTLDYQKANEGLNGANSMYRLQEIERKLNKNSHYNPGDYTESDALDLKFLVDIVRQLQERNEKNIYVGNLKELFAPSTEIGASEVKKLLERNEKLEQANNDLHKEVSILYIKLKTPVPERLESRIQNAEKRIDSIAAVTGPLENRIQYAEKRIDSIAVATKTALECQKALERILNGHSEVRDAIDDAFSVLTSVDNYPKVGNVGDNPKAKGEQNE